VTISVRPENIKITAEIILNGANVLEGRIKDQSVCLGMADYSVDVRGIELLVRSAVNGRAFSGSETVKLQLAPDKCVVVSTDNGDQGHETAATA
jgi:ABC-type Fe3+/spermidine/putrescine transport system ATPase subunit